ncbi:MarR family winged helix-turn-helix transcriptional regulator [Marmoricola sp. RAF53]
MPGMAAEQPSSGAVETGADEVDELVEAWNRERADLDLAPVEVFSRISRLARLLDLARREAFTAQEIEPYEFDVLAALRRTGTPYRLSPGQLLRETMVTSGTMTNRIDRLSERGLVERSPDPHDRRGVLVGLTTAGKRTVDAAFESLIASERELLAELSASERGQLTGLLKRLMRPLR